MSKKKPKVNFEALTKGTIIVRGSAAIIKPANLLRVDSFSEPFVRTKRVTKIIRDDFEFETKDTHYVGITRSGVK